MESKPVRILLRILDVVAVAVWAFVGVRLFQSGTGDFLGDQWTLFAPFFVAVGYLTVRFALPWHVGRGRRADEVPSLTEPPVAVTSCNGWFGPLPFRMPPLRVTVYPDRFVLRVRFAGEHTVLRHEIDSVEDHGLRPNSQVVIRHHTPGTRSPITLWLKKDHHARRAIEHLATPLPPGWSPYQGFEWKP